MDRRGFSLEETSNCLDDIDDLVLHQSVVKIRALVIEYVTI